MKKKIPGKFRGRNVDFEVKGATMSSPPSWWVIPEDPDEPPFPVATVEVREALAGKNIVFSETETLLSETVGELRKKLNSLNSDVLNEEVLTELETLIGTLRMNYVDGRQHRAIMDEYGLPAREEAIAGPLPEGAERSDNV